MDTELALHAPGKKVYIINDIGNRTVELAWKDNIANLYGEVHYAHFVKGLRGLDMSIAFLESRGYIPVQDEKSNIKD